jgi:2'-5' RNA ligase
MNLNISLVLVPIKEQEEKLRKVVDSLAKKYQAYPFIPHITIFYLGTTTLLNEVVSFIDKELSQTRPIDVELKNISYSDVFTKTLFANYQSNTHLIELYNKLSSKFKHINDYQLAPHLSLIYKNRMQDKDKEKEILKLALPKILTLDRLMVITKENGSIAKEEDVLEWKIAHTMSFK